MSAAAYSLEALREYRRRKADARTDAIKAPLTMKDIPPDAPMEEGIVLGCWNGEAFVSWEKWLATAPLSVEGREDDHERTNIRRFDAQHYGDLRRRDYRRGIPSMAMPIQLDL